MVLAVVEPYLDNFGWFLVWFWDFGHVPCAVPGFTTTYSMYANFLSWLKPGNQFTTSDKFCQSNQTRPFLLFGSLMGTWKLQHLFVSEYLCAPPHLFTSSKVFPVSSAPPFSAPPRDSESFLYLPKPASLIPPGVPPPPLSPLPSQPPAASAREAI